MGSTCARADTYTVSIDNSLALGNVIAATSGDTLFRIVPSGGNVNLVSGGGRRLSNTLIRSLVTIRCDDNNNRVDNNDHDNGGGNNRGDCRGEPIYVAIGAIGAPTGRARNVTDFTVSMTSASLVGAPIGSNPVIFKLNPIGNDQSKSFYIGGDFPVAGDESGKPSGDGASYFYVYVTDTSGSMLATTLGSATLRALRGISISKGSDLRFGTVSRAQTSGTVTIAPSTGVRTITGGGYGYPSPAWGPAEFTVSGEGGQTFSVSVPSTLQLSGPTNLNMTPTTTITGTPVLSGAIGAGGSYTFRVGGAFPIANGSIVGGYSGNLTVTVDYN